MKTKKATAGLSLNKLQITKLNNLEVVRGGNGNQDNNSSDLTTFTTGKK